MSIHIIFEIITTENKLNQAYFLELHMTPFLYLSQVQNLRWRLNHDRSYCTRSSGKHVRWVLTKHELSGVKQEVRHEHPVHDHGSDERHQGEQQAGPLPEGAEVVPADVGELPGRGVHRR